MYGRRQLMEINLRLLSKEECSIVVVASIQDDFDFLRGLRMKNLQIVPAPNHPLGHKWQIGVEACRIKDYDPIIILGSDDFLSHGFVTRAFEIMRFYDFVYFDKWFIYDKNKKENYSLDYQMVKFNKPPLGGGRIFSRRYLNRINFKLFDTQQESRLDDFAWNNRLGDCKELINPKDMHILSVKGDWDTMNSLDAILSSEKIAWKKENDLDTYFGFNVKETFK